MDGAEDMVRPFIPSKKFDGKRLGYFFKLDAQGKGYYRDSYQILPKIDNQKRSKAITQSYLLGLLNEDKMKQFVEVFKLHGGELTIERFTYELLKILQEHWKNSDKKKARFTKVIVKLFDIINVDGDDTMGWDEFGAYAMEVANHDKTRETCRFKYYHDKTFCDQTTRRGAYVSCLNYAESVKQLFVTETAGPSVHIYSVGAKPGHLHCIESFTPPTANGVDQKLLKKKGVKTTEVKCVHFLHSEYFGPKGLLAIATDDYRVCLYVKNKRLKRWLMQGYWITTSPTISLAWWSEKLRVFCGHEDGSITSWQIHVKTDDTRNKKNAQQNSQVKKEGENIHQFPCHKICEMKKHIQHVTHLKIILTCKWIVSASVDGSIFAWDLHGGNYRGEFKFHTHRITGLEYSILNNVLVTSAYESDAVGWDTSTREEIFCLKGHRYSIQAMTLVRLEGTDLCVTADKEGNFKVWDINRGLSGDVNCITSFSGAGNAGVVRPLLMTSCGNSPSLICSGRKLDRFQCDEIPASETPIIAVLYNSPTMTILTAGDKHIQIWSAVNGNLLREFFNVAQNGKKSKKTTNNSSICSVCLDDIQGKFIVGTTDGEVLYFRYSNGALLRKATNSPHNGCDVVGITEVGEGDRLLVSWGWDSRIRVHFDNKIDETEKGQSGEDAAIHTIRTIEDATPPGERITAHAFSRRLSLIVSASTGFEIRCFEFCQVRRVAQLHGHRFEITSLALLPLYGILISADSGGIFRMWSVYPRKFALLLIWENKATKKDMLEYHHLHSKTAKASARLQSEIKLAEREEKRRYEKEGGRLRTNIETEGILKARADLDFARIEDKKTKRQFPVAVTHLSIALCSVPNNPDADEDEYSDDSDTTSKMWLLFSADDRGNVKTWNLDPVLKRFDLKPITGNECPCNRMSYMPHGGVTRSGSDKKNPTSIEVGESHAHCKLRKECWRKKVARKKEPGWEEEQKTKRLSRERSNRIRKAREAEEYRTGNRKTRDRLLKRKMAIQIQSQIRCWLEMCRLAKRIRQCIAPEVLSEWRAHKAHLTHIEIIQDPSLPPLILTTSADLAVKLWSINGTARGILRQSHADQMRVDKGLVPWVHWNFCGNGELATRKSMGQDRLERIENDILTLRAQDKKLSSKNTGNKYPSKENSKALFLTEIIEEDSPQDNIVLNIRKNVLSQMFRDKMNQDKPSSHTLPTSTETLPTDGKDGNETDDSMELNELVGLRTSRHSPTHHPVGSPLAAARSMKQMDFTIENESARNKISLPKLNQSKAGALRENTGLAKALSAIDKRSRSHYPHLLDESKRIFAAPTYTGEAKLEPMSAFKETLTGPLGVNGVTQFDVDDERDVYRTIVNDIEIQISRDALESAQKREEFKARDREENMTPKLAYGLRGNRTQSLLQQISQRRFGPRYFGESRQRSLRTREHRFMTKAGKDHARKLMDECEELLGYIEQACRPGTEQRSSEWWERAYDVHTQAEISLAKNAAARRRKSGLPSMKVKKKRLHKAAAASAGRRRGTRSMLSRQGSRRHSVGSRPDWSRGQAGMMIKKEFSRGSEMTQMTPGEFGDYGSSESDVEDLSALFNADGKLALLEAHMTLLENE